MKLPARILIPRQIPSAFATHLSIRVWPAIAAGTVLALTPSTGYAQLVAYQDLHDFGGTIGSGSSAKPDGFNPYCGAVFDKSGNLYGVAYNGGAYTNNGNAPATGGGMVWKLSRNGIYQDLHDFGGTTTNSGGTSGPDGVNPNSAISFDSSGNVYGTTYAGGKYGGGILWEINAGVNYRDLHDFGGKILNVAGNPALDGRNPVGGVAFNSSGTMFGTCSGGGATVSSYANGAGMIWQLAGTSYKDRHDFGGFNVENGVSVADGAIPLSGVSIDSAGNMWGTTSTGGANVSSTDAGGILWEINKNNVYADVHDFGGMITNANGTGGPDGQAPSSGLAFDSSGNVYGTTTIGGPNTGSSFATGGGLLFELTTNSAYIDLHDFGGTLTTSSGASITDGFDPTSAITFDAAGDLFGTTYAGGANGSGGAGGIAYEITAAGAYLDLHDFGGTIVGTNGSNEPDGTGSQGVPAFDSYGNLYATATNGGLSGSQSTGPGLSWVMTDGLQGITLSTTQITGSFSLTGTITLVNGAPVGGATIQVSCGNAAVTTPTSVSIVAGAKTATFTIKTSAVSAPTSTNIIATWGSQTVTTALTLEPPAVTGLSFNPTSVVGGLNSTGTVTINVPAPASGLNVTLSSQLSAVTVPATATIPAGATTGTFTATTIPVATNTSVTIFAFSGTTHASSSLIVKAPTVTGLSIAPATVVGGASTTGTVTISSPAPTAGLTVTLSSGSSAQVPATMLVPGGTTTGTFTITSNPVATLTQDTISATYQSSRVLANLNITAPTVTGLTLSPTTVVGGVSATGTVTISSVAPSAGLNVSVLSSRTSAQAPATVVVPGGTTTATFTITTIPIATSTSVTISATYQASRVLATLNLTAPTVTGLSISPTTVVGGVSATGTVTISSAAPSGGLNVTLQSSRSYVQIPATVVVSGGETTGTFTITTLPVATAGSATISAAYQGSLVLASLGVTAPTVTGLSISPNTVVGGTSTTGTVTISSPAPSTGLDVTLLSTRASAQVPTTAVVPGGSTSVTFTIATSPVPTQTVATIEATYGNSRVLTNLTINPPTLASYSVSPSSVAGGTSATATLTISSAAPTGGLAVKLSNTSGPASFPTTVTVPSGATSVTFSVPTTSTTKTVKVTSIAEFNGQNIATSLTVTPS